MMQPDLFDARYPDVPGSKVPGPSADAAEGMKPSAATLRAYVLGVIRDLGPHTADEAAARLCLSVLSVRPRCSELLALGKIVDTGIRRPNASGRNATVWRVAE